MGDLPPADKIRIDYNRRHNRPEAKPYRCRICGKISPSISWNGYCMDCAVNKVKRIALEIRDEKGHYYQRWKRGMKKWAKGL